MKKGKIVMTITMGIVCYILTYVMFTQFKTVEKTDFDSLKVMQESELRAELAKWKNLYEETNSQLEETIEKTEEYIKKTESNEETEKLLQKEKENLELLAEYTDVTGEGVEITFSDNLEESAFISSKDLIGWVNELKFAGAEAICVNEQRVTNETYFVDIDYGVIKMNGKRLSSPYVIKAIGNKASFELELTRKIADGYNIYAYSINNISYLAKDNIQIPKASENIIFKYATETKKEENK